jgi:hypothetical protein
MASSHAKSAVSQHAKSAVSQFEINIASGVALSWQGMMLCLAQSNLVPTVPEGFPTGLCRIKAGSADGDSVLVRYDDGTVMEIPAHRYIEEGWLPPIEKLPQCPE